MSSSVVDVLNRTADILEDGGWVQHAYETDKGEHCLIGALEVAAPYGTLYSEARNALFDVVGTSPLSWNDMPGRTKEQVIAVVREAAANVDSE